MRTFDSKEKEIIEILAKSNGLIFQDLLSSKLHNKKITLIYTSKTINIRYKTNTFTPDENERKLIESESAELFERIVLAVHLTDYFEKLGFLFLYRNKSKEPTRIIGNKEISDSGILNSIEDERIKDLLLDYVDKSIKVNPSLMQFMKNGFATNEEKHQQTSINLALTGVIIALITSAFSVYYSYQSSLNKDVQTFNKDFNNKMINKDSLFQNIDKISASTIRLNDNIDTLITSIYKLSTSNDCLNKKIDSILTKVKQQYEFQN
jgi:hypothetical protein